MPNFTPRLRLEKPLQTERYDIDIFNANSDIIDKSMATLGADGKVLPEQLPAVQDIQDASLTQKGIVQLENSVTSTSVIKAAVPNSVKTAYDAAAGAQKTADMALEVITQLTHTIDATPTQSGTLTYTGSAQSPGWNSFNPDTLILGGVTTGINAGTYTATFTPKEGYIWSDGTTTARLVAWTIGRAPIGNIPSQSGTLTYTGSAQSPTWNNYDSAKMTIGGTTAETNAGTYSATFTPTANHQWGDGATTAKSVPWVINKAAGSLTINKTSMTLYTSALTGTIAVTRTGDGAITATSSATNVATVSVSGTTVTVTGIATGTATITIIVAAGTNHMAPPSKTCNVDVAIYSATLNSNTWAQIRSASDKGIASNIWSVGATKTIVINGTVGSYTFSNLTVNAMIIGFNHNSNVEGENRIHFQLGKIGNTNIAFVESGYGSSLPSSYFSMNATSTNAGGWNGSRMRTNIMGSTGTPTSPRANSLMSALPSDLLAAMKSCVKYTDNTGGGGTSASLVTATTEYLFLLSEYELFGARTNANAAEQTYQSQYEWYRAGNPKIRYKHNAATTSAAYWLRSRSVNAYNLLTQFCYAEDNGSAARLEANGSWGVSSAFCV